MLRIGRCINGQFAAALGGLSVLENLCNRVSELQAVSRRACTGTRASPLATRAQSRLRREFGIILTSEHLDRCILMFNDARMVCTRWGGAAAAHDADWPLVFTRNGKQFTAHTGNLL